MKSTAVWNHNFAYSGRIARIVGGRRRILDVGCGDGTLALFLANARNRVTGIEPSAAAVKKAKTKNVRGSVEFIETSFESYDPQGVKFDAVIFSASLHHMNMESALAKAKGCLDEKGMLIILGLAKPSSVKDWAVEILRVVPSGIISAIRKNTSSEELDISVSYELPTMNDVRRICGEMLPKYRLSRLLHYRYLLTWEKDKV